MKLLASLLLVLSLPMAGMAADSSDSCGLGWQIMPGETLLATAVRATTNYVIPPTFGMTSGTMGCNQHAIAANDIEKATYAVNNFETLKMEMAAGQGETLDAYAQVMGCDAASFSKMTKKNFSKIYSSSETSAIEAFKNVKTLAAQNCAA